MKEKKKIALKSRLAKVGVSRTNINKIMALDPKVLEKIYLISSDSHLEEVANLIILKNKKSLSPQIRGSYLEMYKERVNEEDNTYVGGLKLLQDAQEEYHLRLIYQILNEETVKQYGLTIEAAEIIADAPSELIANATYNILTNEELIKLGVATFIARVVISNSEEASKVIPQIKELLDSEEKLNSYLKVLKRLKESLRVFVGHPDEEMRMEAKVIDQSLNKLIRLESLENELSAPLIPENSKGRGRRRKKF